MREIKGRLKNTAILGDLSQLVPIMDNVMRWSSKLPMDKRFYATHDELIDALDHPRSCYSMNTSEQFASKTRRYYAMLSEIDTVTKSIQELLISVEVLIFLFLLFGNSERIATLHCTDADSEPSTHHFLQV